MSTTLTIAEVREKIFNKEMLKLLVEDYETGKAYSEMDSADKDSWFTKPVEERADDMTRHILDHLITTLYSQVKQIIEEDQ